MKYLKNYKLFESDYPSYISDTINNVKDVFLYLEDDGHEVNFDYKDLSYIDRSELTIKINYNRTLKFNEMSDSLDMIERSIEMLNDNEMEIEEIILNSYYIESKRIEMSKFRLDKYSKDEVFVNSDRESCFKQVRHYIENISPNYKYIIGVELKFNSI